MLELVYDNDVALDGVPHTVEVYLSEGAPDALVLFVPTSRTQETTCEGFLAHARAVVASIAPRRTPRVLLLQRADRRYRWLDHEPPPPRWRDALDEELRAQGIALA